MSNATRREFLTIGLQASGLAAVSAAGVSVMVSAVRAAPWSPIPPGANEDFMNQCVRCGMCVRACPYDALQLAGLGDPAPLGTPFFTPRDEPCRMCEDIPCVRVCPSGALRRDFEDIKKARMGIAVVDPASCLAWQGLRCEVCWRECPVKNKAITLTPHQRQISKHASFIPTIDPDHCTGCGMCVKGCPTSLPAINIVSRDSVLGRIGEHYRLSWKEEQPHHPGVRRPDAPEDRPAPGGLDWLNDAETKP